MSEMRHFAENITVHGIYHILTNKNTAAKIFWMALFLGSSFYLTYETIGICESFLDYTVITKMEKRSERPIQFPAVTFCPAHAEPVNLSMEDSVNDTKVKEILKQADKGKEFILGYQFEGKSYQYPARFKLKISPDTYYVCYVFNEDGTLFQTRTGGYNGLQITLFLKPLQNIVIDDGVLISVHSHNEFALPDIDGLTAPRGFSSYISLKKRTTIRKEFPYTSNCTNGHHINQILPGKYTLANCEYSCLAEELINQCGWPDSNVLPTYMPKERVTRLLKYYNATLYNECKSREDDVSKSAITAECNCPIPCQELTFEKTLSYLKSSNDSKMDVWVYFEELSHQIITELPEWTFTKLLSNIGGMAGICLGASIFSVTELVILIGCMPFYLFRKKRKDRKDAKAENKDIEDRSVRLNLQM